jgi:hypothetical protein
VELAGRAGIPDEFFWIPGISDPELPFNFFVFRMAPTVHSVVSKEKALVSDPSTYWLTVTNIALGVVVLICCVAVAVGVLQELAAKRKKSVELSKLDREVSDLVASFDEHAFNVPGLGVTMADGGEELRKKEKE